MLSLGAPLLTESDGRPETKTRKLDAQYIIVDDLKREKQRLIDEMYKGSVDGFWGVNDNGMTPDEMIEVTLRIERSPASSMLFVLDTTKHHE